MSCVYPQSDVFRIVEDNNDGRDPGTPQLELISVEASECHNALRQLMYVMESDIRWLRAAENFGHELPIFVVMAHASEIDSADLVPTPYVKEFVQFRDISMPLALTSNLYVYVTDPAAMGLPISLTEQDVLNSPLRFALRVTYIRKQEEIEHG